MADNLTKAMRHERRTRMAKQDRQTTLRAYLDRENARQARIALVQKRFSR